MVRQGKKTDAEEGFGGYDFGESSDSITSASPWQSDEPSGVPALQRMADEFSNTLSLVRNFDEVALVATETRAESDFSHAQWLG